MNVDVAHSIDNIIELLNKDADEEINCFADNINKFITLDQITGNFPVDEKLLIAYEIVRKIQNKSISNKLALARMLKDLLNRYAPNYY